MARLSWRSRWTRLTSKLLIRRKKIEKLLPEGTRGEVEFLQDSMRFVGRGQAKDARLEGQLTTIRRAVMESEVLNIAYQSRHGEPGVRDVEPHGLVCVEGKWMTSGYCRSRKDMRVFRLDRIDRVTRLGEHFTRRKDYSVRRLPVSRPRGEEIRVLFTGEALRWAREERYFSFIREEEHPGGTVMVFAPRDDRDLIPWLLNWAQERGCSLHQRCNRS